MENKASKNLKAAGWVMVFLAVLEVVESLLNISQVKKLAAVSPAAAAIPEAFINIVLIIAIVIIVIFALIRILDGILCWRTVVSNGIGKGIKGLTILLLVLDSIGLLIALTSIPSITAAGTDVLSFVTSICSSIAYFVIDIMVLKYLGDYRNSRQA